MSILIKSLFLLNILFSPSFAGIFDFKSNDEKLYDILVDLNQDTKQYKNQLDISKNAERLFKIFKEKYKNVDNKLLNSITRFYNYRLDYGWDYSAQVKLKLLENFANKKIDLRILLDLMESFNDVRELTPFLSLFEKYASREKPIDEALELQKVFNTFSECAFPKSDPRKTVFKPVVEAFQQQKLCLNEFKKFYPLMCPNDVSFLIVDSQDKCKNINEKYKSLYEFVSKLN